MKAILRLSVAICAFLLTISTYAQLPSVKVENQKGEVISTSTLLRDGKPMIISFWSCSCKNCIMELDAINEIDKSPFAGFIKERPDYQTQMRKRQLEKELNK